jgi:hypothetical protein
LTSRAREGFTIEWGSCAADTDRLPLEGPSAFVGVRKDCEIRTGRYPTTRRPVGTKFSTPRLARLGSGAREAHRVLGTYLGPTRGDGGWRVQKSNAASCLTPAFVAGPARGVTTALLLLISTLAIDGDVVVLTGVDVLDSAQMDRIGYPSMPARQPPV